MKQAGGGEDKVRYDGLCWNLERLGKAGEGCNGAGGGWK